MFGQNPIRKKEPAREDGKLAVQEIFHTIQGEGPFAGRPAVFIRLAGCNLACTFCDTEFESGIDNYLGVGEIIKQISDARPVLNEMPSLVVITGGEPMRQEIGPLVSQLLALWNFTDIQIETAGTLWLESLETWIDEDNPTTFVTIVCSPKTALVNPMLAAHCYHWKYIVRAGEIDPALGLPCSNTQGNRAVPLYRPSASSVTTIWMQPMDEQDPVKNKANQDEAVQTCLQFGYNLCLQVHKLVGLP